MRIGIREIVLNAIIATILVATPTAILPTISHILSLNMFKGFQGISIYVKRVMIVIPIPVLGSPDAYTFTGFFLSTPLLIAYNTLRARIYTRQRLKQQVTDFITVFSSYVRSGATIAQALEFSAEFVGEPMQSYVIRFSRFLQLGLNPFEVFEKVFGSTPREVKTVLSCIPVAIESGGRVADVLTQAERFSFQLSRLEELRRARLEGYKAILFLAIVAYTFSAIVTAVLTSFIAKMAVVTPFAKTVVDIRYVLSLYYISSLIISAISSIAISRIVYGETILALKYTGATIIFVSLAYAIAFRFI